MSLAKIAMAAATQANVGMNNQDVILFLNGLMTTLVQDDNLEAVEICVQDIDGLDVEIAQAVADFKTGHISDIISGAKLIGEVLAQAKGDEANCKDMENDWKRIDEWAAIFKNPHDLLNVVLSHVIENKSHLSADISQIKADESSGNFKDLGATVGDFIVNVVGEVPNAPSPFPLKELAKMVGSLTKNEVILFLNGLIDGLVHDDNLENVEKCVTDVEGMDTEIEEAIAEFKKGGVSNIIAGGKLIGQIVSQASADISQCEEMKDDWRRITTWAAIFKNPSQLVQTVFSNLIANRSGIMADIAELKSDETTKNWKDLGETVGDLATKAFGEVPTTPSPVHQMIVSMVGSLTKSEVLLFLNGLVTGLVQDDNLENIEKCVTDVEGMDTEIEDALADFKKGGISDIIAGGKEVYKVISQAKADISQCEEMSADWERLESWASIFEHPTQLIPTVFKNVLANRSGIEADISELKSDETSANYKDFGLTVADILVKSIGEVPTSTIELF
jgi:exonuclease VII small subunit